MKARGAVRGDEAIDRLAQICFDEARARAATLTRKIVQEREVVRRDGTVVPAGTELVLAPEHGLCETINWVAAEALEILEGTRWSAIAGRIGYGATEPGVTGVIVSHHVIIARGIRHAEEFDEHTMIADFSFRSAFWEDDHFPPAIIGLAGDPHRGIQLVHEGLDLAYSFPHAWRVNDPVLGDWVAGAGIRAAQRYDGIRS